MARANNNGYRFSVTDHGQGIAENEKHKLFGLFQQLGRSNHRPTEGTGLGLAICKGIVEQHRGTIGVDSKVGQGSTFWFELPDGGAPSAALAVTKQVPAVYKALLLDDDQQLRRNLSATLEAQGCAVDRADSLKEAEVCLNSNGNPDVIVLAFSSPDGNAVELMDGLRHNRKCEQTPVIVLSTRPPDQRADVNPLLLDWIQEPYEEKRLLSALRLALRKRVSGPARILLAEDDLPTRELVKQELEALPVECIEAADGITAVHLARTKDPDLIVLDVGMPGLSGFEVVKMLQRERCQKTPLIVYTARDLSDGDKQSLVLGTTIYLIKSRTGEGELLNAVRTLLNGLVSKSTARVYSKKK